MLTDLDFYFTTLTIKTLPPDSYYLCGNYIVRQKVYMMFYNNLFFSTFHKIMTRLFMVSFVISYSSMFTVLLLSTNTGLSRCLLYEGKI